MNCKVSIRELRESAATVVSRIEAGERLTLTVGGRAVADIVPHARQGNPWIPGADLHRIVRESPADPGLLDDLFGVRRSEIEES